MGVELGKPGDHVTEPVAGSGANDGTGRLRIIGGLPVDRVDGPLIRVSGMRYAGRAITCVAIERVRGEVAQTSLISTDGVAHSYGDVGNVNRLRGEWLRRTINAGTFAGIGRMR
ncbi:hypothetical protein ACFW2V_13355 [Streptomyces sp. NPDC058947]|uniref:hypothetical protein n=1 Tax=Streptomyces sp. NPDC058947 TaxID=3346675 RepID=UPI0036A1A4BC